MAPQVSRWAEQKNILLLHFKGNVSFCPLSVPICHYQIMMENRLAMPVSEAVGEGVSHILQWK